MAQVIPVVDGKIPGNITVKKGFTIFPVIDIPTQDRRKMFGPLADASALIAQRSKGVTEDNQIREKIVWRNAKTQIIDNPDGTATLIPRYDVVDNFAITLAVVVGVVLVSFFAFATTREFRIVATEFADEGALGGAARGFQLFGLAALAFGAFFLIGRFKRGPT